MAYGYHNGVSLAVKVYDAFIRTEYLQPEDWVLINSIAVEKAGTVQVLSNHEEVYKIAEEYAHAGIKLLHEQVTSQEPGSYIKRFEKEITNLSKQLGTMDK